METLFSLVHSTSPRLVQQKAGTKCHELISIQQNNTKPEKGDQLKECHCFPVACEKVCAKKSSSYSLEVELRGLVEGLEAFGKERLQRKIK